MSRSLLVTGGAGFIGSNFCHYWLNAYPADTLVVLDKLTYAGNEENLKGCSEYQHFHFVRGDICDQSTLEALFAQHCFDTVVHFAAESHVDRSISGPDAFIETNILGTYALLKVAKQFWLEGSPVPSHRFHHVSTDEVYGSLGAEDPAFSETTAYAPNSPYSASKASSDHLVRAYAHTFGLRVSTSNCSNNYGPRQHAEKLIPLTIQKILNAETIPVYGNGSNIRDWLYVEDHCRAIDLILQSGDEGEVYNVGGENEWRNIDIVTVICEHIDQRFASDVSLANEYPRALFHQGRSSTELINFVQDRAGHDYRYAIDPSKCHDKLAFRPEEDFHSGIAKTIHWYLKQNTQG